MIEPCIGFVPRAAPVRYVIYFEKRGSYAELNLHTLTWTLGAFRHATQFDDLQCAEAAIKHIDQDCGDLWHLTREDLHVREKS